MARFHLILLATLLYYVTYIYAVATVETPLGPIAQGASITISYKVTGVPAAPVTLKAVDQTSKSETVISSDLPPALSAFSWTVNVPPSTYVLAINDGTGQAFSGPFTVIAGKAPVSSGPPGAPSSTPPGVTTVPTSPSAAPTSSSPGATDTQAAPTSGGQTPPQSSPSAGSPSGSPSSGPSGSTTTPKSSSSRTSFSGYSLLFSLGVVAAAMFHLA